MMILKHVRGVDLEEERRKVEPRSSSVTPFDKGKDYSHVKLLRNLCLSTSVCI